MIKHGMEDRAKIMIYFIQETAYLHDAAILAGVQAGASRLDIPNEHVVVSGVRVRVSGGLPAAHLEWPLQMRFLNTRSTTVDLGWLYTC